MCVCGTDGRSVCVCRIGLNPSDEYTLLIMCIPVGDYYKGGLSPVAALVIDDYDRAAPKGVGNVKVRTTTSSTSRQAGSGGVGIMTPWRWVVHDDQVAGNYAADLLPNMLGKKKGFPIGTDQPPTHTHTTPHLPTFLPAASRVVAEALSSTVLWCCG